MRVVTLVTLTALVLAGCAGTQEPIQSTGAVVYTDANVWTADDEKPWAEAFAVVDGRFGAVGSADEVLAAHPGARVESLGGRFVMPGFHDTHNHLLRAAFGSESLGPGTFEPSVSPWDPVMGPIGQQETGLAHIQNYLFINAGRLQSGGQPAPPMHIDDVHSHKDRMTDVGVWKDGFSTANLGVVQDALARFGITSSVEAGAPLASLAVLQDLEQEGLLTARYNLYVFPEDLDGTLAQGFSTGSGTDQARLLGLKIYSDGWLGPRTAAMREMYEDRPHSGFAFYTQDELDDWVARAHAGGLKLTAHTIGDRAVEQLLTAYERSLQTECVEHVVCEDPRFTLEHVQLVADDLMERMVALELVPNIQMSFATTDSHYAEDAIGDRLADAYPWQTMHERGLRMGGSSDWPIEVLPPLWGIERMVTRQEVDGSLAEPFMPEQALPLDVALRMITIDAAYLEHRDHEVGSISEGKFADFVVLSQDLFAIDPSTIAETEVEATVLGGRVVHGQLTS